MSNRAAYIQSLYSARTNFVNTGPVQISATDSGPTDFKPVLITLGTPIALSGSVTSNPTISFGINGPNYDDIVASFTPNLSTGPDLYLVTIAGPSNQVSPASIPVFLNVTVAGTLSTGGQFEYTIRVYGLYD